MFTSIWATVVSLFSGLISLANKVAEHIRETQLINRGIEIEKAAQTKRELEIVRRQTEAVLEEETRDDTSKKLKDGTFRTHVTINTPVETGDYGWRKSTDLSMSGLIDDTNGTMLVVIGVLIMTVMFVLQIP